MDSGSHWTKPSCIEFASTIRCVEDFTLFIPAYSWGWRLCCMSSNVLWSCSSCRKSQFNGKHLIQRWGEIPHLWLCQQTQLQNIGRWAAKCNLWMDKKYVKSECLVRHDTNDNLWPLYVSGSNNYRQLVSGHVTTVFGVSITVRWCYWDRCISIRWGTTTFC